MKSVIVKNLEIQFDCFDETSSDMDIAINTLNSINSVLQEQLSDICPQIFVSAIDDDDIEVAEQEL